MKQLSAWNCALAIVCASTAYGAANVQPDKSEAWGANLGWINWRPDPANGVEIGQFVCAGYLYSQNVGWIYAGTGLPRDGQQYRNDSPKDCGINMDTSGNLRGFAYGANIGWIQFEKTGAPRIDLQTGAFTGFAYGANVGWINLGQEGSLLAADSISAGADTDGDGIPDAWELFYAGSLTVLSATGDADHDGQSDYEEYLADTDPFDPNDRFEVTQLSRSSQSGVSTISWTSKASRQYQIEARTGFDQSQPWSDPGLGLQSADGSVTTRSFTAGVAPEYFRIRAVRPLSK